MMTSFYKYLNQDGLEKTLRSGKLQFSSPTIFNDPFDMKVDEVSKHDPVEHLEEYLKAVCAFFRRDEFPSIPELSPMGIEMKEAYESLRGSKDNGKELLKEVIASFEEIFDANRYKKNTEMLINIAKEIFDTTAVLCGSKRPDNLILWALYAERYKGGVIKFRPSIEKDSMLTLAKEVRYSVDRPFLYNSYDDFIYKSLLPDLVKAREFSNLIFYTKGMDWRQEEELRICIPRSVPRDGKRYLLYYPEEIDEIYIGYEMVDEKKDEIVNLAKSMNPSVKIFRMEMNPSAYGLIPKLIP